MPWCVHYDYDPKEKRYTQTVDDFKTEREAWVWASKRVKKPFEIRDYVLPVEKKEERVNEEKTEKRFFTVETKSAESLTAFLDGKAVFRLWDSLSPAVAYVESVNKSGGHAVSGSFMGTERKDAREKQEEKEKGDRHQADNYREYPPGAESISLETYRALWDYSRYLHRLGILDRRGEWGIGLRVYDEIALILRNFAGSLGGEKKEEKEMKTGLSEVSPEHYTKTPMESREVIEAMGLGMGYNRGAAIKYIHRAGGKPGNSAISDLEKARMYLAFEIERLALEDGSEEALETAVVECVSDRRPSDTKTFQRLLRAYYGDTVKERKDDKNPS